MDVIQENILLNTVFERLVFGLTKKYQWQAKHPDEDDCFYLPTYCPIHCKHGRCEHLVPLNQEHLRQHFSQQLWKNYPTQKLTYSGLSLAGLFPGGRVRWLMLDMDTPLTCHAVRTCLLPVLDKFEIDYLWEHSGRPDYEKAHCLILMDCTLLLQRTFVPMLLTAAGLENWQQWNLERPEDFKLEIFPYQLEDNMIRLPGSVHQRTGRVNQCTFKTITSNAKEIIMGMLGIMGILDSSRITELITILSPEHEERLRIHEQVKSAFKSSVKFTSPKDFKYIPLNLTLPAIPVPYPRTIKKMFSNCQALNALWFKTVMENALQRGNIHKWGLFLANFALFDDLQNYNRQLPSAYSMGERFIDYVYNDLRAYGDEGHNWKEYKKKFHDEPLGLIPSCEKMHRTYGQCKGCLYADQPDFRTPSQFVTGTPIIRTVTKQVRMVTNEYVRTYEFPQIKSWIKNCVFQKKYVGAKTQQDIVLAHHQGSGKSICADELMAEMSYCGGTTLLAVPDAKLALQHKSILDSLGQLSMVIFSFVKLFSEQVKAAMGTSHDCPHYDSIKSILDVFPLSAYVKDKFCESCPYARTCPYPKQYANIATSPANIIIIQHAHLLTRPARLKILKRRYDLTVIDENFLDKCFVDYRASDQDKYILQFLIRDYRWLKKVLHWIKNGGYPDRELDVDIEDLQRINYILGSLSIENFLPELIQHFLAGDYYHPIYGIQKFVPLPDSYTGTRLFTDATIPIDYFKVCVNNEDPVVFGADNILNIKAYHPLSEYRQILDGSTSVTQMNKPGYLELLLRHACKKMEKANGQGLFTTYANLENQARQFIWQEFPHLYQRLDVSHMKLGTNEYQNHNFQFLAASCYPDAPDLTREAWKLSVAWNHWLDKQGECLGREDRATVPFYDKSAPGGSYPTNSVQLTRTEILDGRAYKTRYYDLFVRVPIYPLYAIAADMYRSVKSQSARLRPRPGFFTDITDYDRIETNWLVTSTFSKASMIAEVSS